MTPPRMMVARPTTDTDRFHSDLLTPGKAYEVVDVEREDGFIYVKDNTGGVTGFWYTLFKEDNGVVEVKEEKLA